METIQVLAPLAGVVLGSALTGVSTYFKDKKERRRIIAVALADLLEVRHHLVSKEMVVSAIRSKAGIQPGWLTQLRSAIDAMAPLDTGIHQRYDAAISLLAGVDPVLAFKMRSKNLVPSILSKIRTQTPEGADSALLDLAEVDLIGAVAPTLDLALLTLSRKHSFSTARQVGSIIARSTVLPPEVTKLLSYIDGANPSSPR
ncbi:hypothetical protein [Variovorax sp. efr-133-TYG-130]|uniref:hypothetical protein n=1 Tax=Variovorax sp. efr-133-TYG-130 TaxID=3040327 RepID=UPI0025571348|nr:hypothetical protein [Variovorax sp. efr-133-TYG-130]